MSKTRKRWPQSPDTSALRSELGGAAARYRMYPTDENLAIVEEMRNRVDRLVARDALVTVLTPLTEAERKSVLREVNTLLKAASA